MVANLSGMLATRLGFAVRTSQGRPIPEQWGVPPGPSPFINWLY